MNDPLRWYREQEYRHKLRNVLQSPLSDIRDVKAAKLAIKQKLDDNDRRYNQSIINKAQELKKLL